MKSIATTALLGVMLLASCSGLRGHVRYAPSPSTALVSSTTPPNWLRELPKDGSSIYAVGESDLLSNKQDALESAWANALLRMGLTSFPELSQVESKSVESLTKSEYRRTLTLRFQNIEWEGVREKTELGSPHLVQTGQGRVRVYRLLEWPRTALAGVRSKMKREGLLDPSVPASPSLKSALHSIQKLNDRFSNRDKQLEKIFKSLECGVTLKDVIHALGKPDSSNPNNARIVQKDYRWGNFTAWRIGSDPRIAAVTKQGLSSPFKVVCPRSWVE